ADGSGRHDPAGPTPARPGVVGLKCHLRAAAGFDGLLQLHAIDHSAGRGYFGVVGIEGGQMTLAMAVGTSLVRAFTGDHDAMLDAACPASRAWERTSDWFASS